jgi:hypothetical protein
MTRRPVDLRRNTTHRIPHCMVSPDAAAHQGRRHDSDLMIFMNRTAGQPPVDGGVRAGRYHGRVLTLPLRDGAPSPTA